jgi:hypothetical protein
MPSARPHIYHVDGPEVPWGDYGAILMSGMTAHLDRSEGLLQLERTGPFIPAISFPGDGDIVITDVFKNLLEGSGLTGFSFKPVIKARIVRLRWQEWDRDLDDPPHWPREGEPENYILDRKHSPETADEMGEIWELCVESAAHITFEPTDRPLEHDVFVDLGAWDGRDWFRGQGPGYNLVTEKAKDWLEGNAREWVKFEPIAIVEIG